MTLCCHGGQKPTIEETIHQLVAFANREHLNLKTIVLSPADYQKLKDEMGDRFNGKIITSLWEVNICQELIID